MLKCISSVVYSRDEAFRELRRKNREAHELRVQEQKQAKLLKQLEKQQQKAESADSEQKAKKKKAEPVNLIEICKIKRKWWAAVVKNLSNVCVMMVIWIGFTSYRLKHGK